MSGTNHTTKLILEYLNTQNCFVWRQNVGRVPGRAVPKSQQGIADIIGIDSGGRFLAIEVKEGKDRLNYRQELFHSNIAMRRGISIVCYSFDEFLEKFKAQP